MRIAIITNGSLPVPNVKGGGVETLTTQFIDVNENEKKNKIKIFSITNEAALEKSTKYNECSFVFMEPHKQTIVDKIKYRVFNKYSVNSPYSYKKAIKSIKKGNYDSVIIENTTWPMEYAAKKLGDKLWLHLHNDWINDECSVKDCKRFVKSISKMSGVVTVSQYIKDRILTIKGISNDKVKVLKNCTDSSVFGIEIKQESIDSFKEKYGIEKEVVLVFTGRISKQKGLLQLIKAINMVDASYDIRLLIAGSSKSGEEYVDEYTKKVLEEIRKSDKKINFTGYIPHEELNLLYAVADIAILPSMWEDPAPLTVFESLASGLPIITTNSGGIPEYANDSCAVFCEKEKDVEVQLRDAIEILVRDKNKREKMGEESKRLSLMYTVEKYYNDFNKILSSNN